MSTLIGIAIIVFKVLFVSRTTDSLNMVPIAGDKDYRNPTVCTLFCLFIPFYTIYWVYKMALRVDRLMEMKGRSERVTTLYTILAIFVQPVALILMYIKLQEFANEE